MSTENENFDGWDKNEPQYDFFGEQSNPKSVIEEVKEDTLVEEEKKEELKKEKEKIETPASFFEEPTEELIEIPASLVETQEEEKKEEPSKKTEKPTKVDISSTLNLLKEKGFASFELEEGEELTNEKAQEILEDSLEAKVDDKIQDLTKNISKVGQDFLKFLNKGGKEEDFFKVYAQLSNRTSITADIDLTKEENQIAVLNEVLSQEGFDADTINTQIEFLKDSGKLQSFSNDKFKVWKEKDDAKKQEILKNQESLRLQQKQQRKELKEKVSTLIEDKKDLKGLSLTKKEKKELPSYMTDQSYKLDNGQYITEMQKDLHEALQDEENAVLLAKLLKSGFDFSSIKKQLETKVAEKAESSLRRKENDNSPSKSGQSNSHRAITSLADIFPD